MKKDRPRAQGPIPALRAGVLAMAAAFSGLVLSTSIMGSPAGAAVQGFLNSAIMTGDACATSTQCLVVGQNIEDGGGYVAPVEASSGTILAGQVASDPGGGPLNGVSCSSTTQCTAVGNNYSYTSATTVPLNPSTGVISSGQASEAIT